MERAARIAFREMLAALQANPTLERVMAVCFGREALRIHREALADTEKGQD